MKLSEPGVLPNIRVNTQAIEILNQANIVKAIYAEMEEVWLHLHTEDKKCPIVEEIGTIVKRKLIRQYTVHLIKRVRATLGFDLVTKTIDPDASYWFVDDVVIKMADSKIENHYYLFCSLLNTVFGLSIRIIDLMFLEEVTIEAMNRILSDFYYLSVNEVYLEDVITVEKITERLEAYMNGEDQPLFEVSVF